MSRCEIAAMYFRDTRMKEEKEGMRQERRMDREEEEGKEEEGHLEQTGSTELS